MWKRCYWVRCFLTPFPCIMGLHSSCGAVCVGEGGGKSLTQSKNGSWCALNREIKHTRKREKHCECACVCTCQPRHVLRFLVFTTFYSICSYAGTVFSSPNSSSFYVSRFGCFVKPKPTIWRLDLGHCNRHCVSYLWYYIHQMFNVVMMVAVKCLHFGVISGYVCHISHEYPIES